MIRWPAAFFFGVFLNLLALIGTVTMAQGQEIIVRSGEHGAFTRLVFDLPEGSEWALTNRKDGADLTVGVEGITFNTDAVFGRLSDQRLRRLHQTAPGSALEIDFACECIAIAFVHDDRLIVVDIAEGKYAQPAQQVLPDIVPTLPTPPDSELALSLLSLRGQHLDRQIAMRLLQGADRNVVDLELADQGHIGPLRIPQMPDPLMSGANHIRISSILDNIDGFENMRLPDIESLPACITDAELDFQSWAGTQPFPIEHAELRIGMYGEFDRVIPEKVLSLARLYAYYGFDIEAAQILALLDPMPDTASRIATIAKVGSNQPLDAPNPFAHMQRCQSSVALWAVLSEGVLDPNAQIDAIELAFVALPEHLRRQLGSLLSGILLRAGRIEAARRIVRSTDRVVQEDQPDLTMAKANIAGEAGKPEKEEILLKTVVENQDGDSSAALALARLVEKRWSDRGSVSPAELDLISAYALEYRGSELGDQMIRANIVALALTQHFDKALDLFEQAGPDMAGAQRSKSQTRLLTLIVERSDDVTFLRHAFSISDGLPTKTLIAVADRLVSLGFPSQAAAVLDGIEAPARRFERNRIAARAALLGDDPERALRHLDGDSSAKAQFLRARALSQIGDHAQTAVLLSSLGQQDEAVRHAWLADQISEVDIASAGQFEQIVTVSDALAQPVIRDPDKPLRDAGLLLESSSRTRALVETLLTETDGMQTSSLNSQN